MFWVSKVIAPLALVLGIAGTALLVSDANAQPPFGKGGQPGKGGKNPFGKGDDKKVEEKKVEKKDGQPGDKKGQPGAKSDAVVDAWLKVLIDKITDPHDTVRDSARGAIVAVGPPAIPALQKLVDGNDPAKAVAAQKLINAIQGRGPGQPGPGQPGRPGMGFGMGGMGGPGMGPMGGPGGAPGMNPGPARPDDRGRGPGGFGPPGMGPGGERGRNFSGFGEWGRGFGGWGRGGRGAGEIEVAPMPRPANR